MKFSTVFSSLLLASAALAAGSAAAATIEPFSLPWVNNSSQDGTYRMVDHPNGIFVLEAFQNFCPHCHNNESAVESLYNKYKAQTRVQVIDLDLDNDQGEVQAWLDEYHPAFPVVQDANADVFNQFPDNDGGIPQAVVLNCKGEVKYHTEGEWDSQTEREIGQVIDGLLKEQCN